MVMKHYHTYVMGLIVCIATLTAYASADDKGQVQQVLPPNTESEYLKTVAVSILLNGNVTPTEISYTITLKVRKPLPESAIAVLKFENPDPRAAPVEVVYEPKPDQKEIFVISPSVACIVNGRHYRVVVTLFADRERRIILGTHEQMVAFFAPAMILKTLGVPECSPTEQGRSGESQNLPQTNQLNGVRAEQLPILNIDFPKGEAWDIAYTERKGGQQIIEYTAGGEKADSLTSWSQLVSFLYIPLPKEGRRNIQDATKSMLSRIETGCSSFKGQILAESEHMVVFRWSGEGCGGLPPQEVIARYEYIDAGLISLQYTYYKQKAKPDFEAWIRRVIDAKITHESKGTDSK